MDVTVTNVTDEIAEIRNKPFPRGCRGKAAGCRGFCVKCVRKCFLKALGAVKHVKQ